LTEICEGQKQSTKRHKFTLLKSFFNFCISATGLNFLNPCDAPVFKKSFRAAKGHSWTILEKDVVDEIIFKTEKPRNRLILELMARGGMRIGEVLKLRAMDVDERKLRVKNPKSGREFEVVFIPQKVADRLKLYLQKSDLDSEQRVFSLGYSGAREMVKNAGKSVGIKLRPHDLRRHAAMYASRAGAPLEIVSKVILRHANLRPSDTWGRSLILRRSDGLKISTAKN
jgi:integrase